MTWRKRVAVMAIVALLVVPTFVPEMLLFPHQADSGAMSVYSEQPINQAALDKITTRSATLTAASPIRAPEERRTVFLTNGGWRWTWLALQNRGAFAISRPGRETIVFNRSDVARDEVRNGRDVGGDRTLSATLAHETCHGMLRRHFAIGFDWRRPAWLREGYCDHVAQESSLSAAEAVRLKASGTAHPALVYYDGRKKVSATLAANGNDVDALFGG